MTGLLEVWSGRLFYPWGGTGNVSGRNNFWRKNKKSQNFSLDLFLLVYTHYQGDCTHRAHWGWLNLAEHNDWPPGGLIQSLGECVTLGEVQAMSLGGIIIFGGKIKKSQHFPPDLSFLLDYTHYQGDCIHRVRREWLNLAEHNDLPPEGLIWSLGECFSLWEVQANVSRRNNSPPRELKCSTRHINLPEIITMPGRKIRIETQSLWGFFTLHRGISVFSASWSSFLTEA